MLFAAVRSGPIPAKTVELVLEGLDPIRGARTLRLSRSRSPALGTSIAFSAARCAPAARSPAPRALPRGLAEERILEQALREVADHFFAAGADSPASSLIV